MLGASWGKPECIFEVNNRFIGTYTVGMYEMTIVKQLLYNNDVAS